MNLPPELAFLSQFYDEPGTKRRPNWLLSEIESNVWTYNFGFKKNLQLHWEISLGGNRKLTDNKHKDLLNCFKQMLIESTRTDGKISQETSSIKAQQASFGRTIKLIDHLLLNNDKYKLSQYGLAGLSLNDLRDIYLSLTSHPETAESTYNWSQNLRKLCIDLLESTDPNEISSTIIENPEMLIISSEQLDNDTLKLPFDRIPEIRAALYINDYMHRSKHGWAPHTQKLSKKIYRNTLKGHETIKPNHIVLCFKGSRSSYTREYDTVPHRTGNPDVVSSGAANQIRASILKLSYLHEFGLPAPRKGDLAQVLEFPTMLSKSGRFRSQPSDIVFSSVRNAIEFHLKYGDIIIDGFCRLALHCVTFQILPTRITNDDFKIIIGSELYGIGVRKLGLSVRQTGVIAHGQKIKDEKAQYFINLRSNIGLLELVGVYLGATQIVTGALMARRTRELRDLDALTCLDQSSAWLAFRNSKSTRNLFGTRTLEVRPIEPIGVKMIKNLIRMQQNLENIGYISNTSKLFSTPNLRGIPELSGTTPDTYNGNLDLFCDYFEVRLNSNGKRHYIRQHQLRRFFAMLFFNTSTIGGLETLQWMMGHSDLEHAWNYITESLDGATLRGAKVQFVAENIIRDGCSNYDELSALISSKYGTDNFSLIDTDELENYLDQLLTEEKIEIEPFFFEDALGHQMRLIVKVSST